QGHRCNLLGSEIVNPEFVRSVKPNHRWCGVMLAKFHFEYEESNGSRSSFILGASLRWNTCE
ncbi:hypothetical protein AVEN_136119-1, partial [Araneus ventricosus]